MTMRMVLANAKERRQLAPGEVVFAEGDSGDRMFGVVTGQIELRHGDNVVHTVGPEGTFGEMAIIYDAPRSLTAVAVEPTEVAVINRHTFLFLVHETPTFAIDVMRSLAERIRALDVR